MEGKSKGCARPPFRGQFSPCCLFSKWKFKDSEKSKFEFVLPGHYESIFVRVEGDKIAYLIVC